MRIRNYNSKGKSPEQVYRFKFIPEDQDHTEEVHVVAKNPVKAFEAFSRYFMARVYNSRELPEEVSAEDNRFAKDSIRSSMCLTGMVLIVED